MQWLETKGVAFAQKWTRKMTEAVVRASSVLHPDNDIMVVCASTQSAKYAGVHRNCHRHCHWLWSQVRLPVAQACVGSKWRASCGLTHDIGNTFIAGLSGLLDSHLANISAGPIEGVAPWGVDVARCGGLWSMCH